MCSSGIRLRVPQTKDRVLRPADLHPAGKHLTHSYLLCFCMKLLPAGRTSLVQAYRTRAGRKSQSVSDSFHCFFIISPGKACNQLSPKTRSSFSVISSISDSVITSGGTSRSTFSPALITTSPFFSAFAQISPTRQDASSCRPCISPFPRRSFTQSKCPASSSRASSR